MTCHDIHFETTFNLWRNNSDNDKIYNGVGRFTALRFLHSFVQPGRHLRSAFPFQRCSILQRDLALGVPSQAWGKGLIRSDGSTCRRRCCRCRRVLAPVSDAVQS